MSPGGHEEGSQEVGVEGVGRAGWQELCGYGPRGKPGSHLMGLMLATLVCPPPPQSMCHRMTFLPWSKIKIDCGPLLETTPTSLDSKDHEANHTEIEYYTEKPSAWQILACTGVVTGLAV